MMYISSGYRVEHFLSVLAVAPYHPPPRPRPEGYICLTLDLSYGQGAMAYAHSLAVFSFVQCEMSAGCFSSTRSHCLVHERPGYRLGMGRWAGL